MDENSLPLENASDAVMGQPTPAVAGASMNQLLYDVDMVIVKAWRANGWTFEGFPEPILQYLRTIGLIQAS